MGKQQVVSAQVVLRSASGKSPHGQAITAATIGEYLPSPQAAGKVPPALAALGFAIGALVGNSFSISAPATTFEHVFKTKLRDRAEGGIEAVRSGGHGSVEMVASALPHDIAQHIEAITFTPPPDFGPQNFGP